MPRGNPAIKVAITVDSEVHAELLNVARAEGVSVSAWLTEAARRALRIRDGLAGVVEWEREHGALTADEIETARRKLAKPGRRRSTKR